MRKTKIICTLGPSSDTEPVIRALAENGMNVARFNFSHDDYEIHKKKFDILAKVSQELDLPIATLLDTRGPEIRIGTFKEGKVDLVDGQTFTLTTQEIEGDSSCVSISYKDICKDVKQGTTILLDDGLIQMEVIQVTKDSLVCQVFNGGTISNRKGVNIPGVHLNMPYLNEKDTSDIVFGAKAGFDFIAASFTRTADDIRQIRRILNAQNSKNTKIIAKIENLQGVENIDDILLVADGIMIARGDMGVEIPLEEVPILQKELIKKAYSCGRLVITATQMLDSMIKNPRPTRAEATDVANAIYDGTSAIMLSGETASGKYPVEALKTMSQIAERTEQDIDYKKRFSSISSPTIPDITNAISHATVTTAYDLDARAIATVTLSGQTARLISRYRPQMPILGCTPCEKTYRQLSMSWGVVPLKIDIQKCEDDLFTHAIEVAREKGYVNDGDITVITAGIPVGVSGTTNMIKVHMVGDILVSGRGINKLSAIGKLCVAANADEAMHRFHKDDILVIPQTTNDLIPLLRDAKGVICEENGVNSHAAIVGQALDIPVIVGAKNASKILKNGTLVSVDADAGLVYSA